MRRRNRINQLPDKILHRILSFLTTKEAVTTSILSKRWIHLWISVPNLNFTNITIDSIKSNNKFNESVYSVLASRDGAGYDLDGFHLDIQYVNHHFAYRRSFPHVVKWINIVVRRNLKHLNLNHDIDEPDTYDPERDAYLPQLPKSILTCRTLVSLKLSRFSVEGLLYVSKVEFGFPCLKTLYFDTIYFGCGRNFVLLLCGCPVLEDLQLLNSCQTLSSRQDSEAIQMFQSLTLPNLTRAEIMETLWSHFPLKALSTVKSLSLDTLKLNTHDQTDDEDDDEENPRQRTYIDIPIFHNLTHLKFKNSWGLVVQMLHHCPKLQSLELSKGSRHVREDELGNSAEEPELVPECVSSCLKTCTIRDIGGLQSELILPTFILKNARILQTMKVWSGWMQKKSEIEEKLSPCPKASATCQLFVY
ncbi:unnamed protein product [Trifolium pratense]|uniref:Uncharacterized protein n=1 Tax=Trifolium pratense TaxID=57577 RepID=A0ACB0J523_TRIPR|nr:unnamed protein product [Trifolium pratense]